MTWLKPKPQVVLVLKTCTMVSTVAILAQGASLALASQQAFCIWLMISMHQWPRVQL